MVEFGVKDTKFENSGAQKDKEEKKEEKKDPKSNRWQELNKKTQGNKQATEKENPPDGKQMEVIKSRVLDMYDILRSEAASREKTNSSKVKEAVDLKKPKTNDESGNDDEEEGESDLDELEGTQVVSGSSQNSMILMYQILKLYQPNAITGQVFNYL